MQLFVLARQFICQFCDHPFARAFAGVIGRYPMTLKELLGLYISSKRHKPVTLRGLTNALKYLSQHCAGMDTPVNAISLEQIVAYRIKMAVQVQPITFNSYLAQQRAVFRFGVSQGICDASHPFFQLRKARVPRRPPPVVGEAFFSKAVKFLTQPKSTQLREVMRPRWFWYAVLVMLTFTGIRRRQLCALRWHDIDFDQWVISLSSEGSKNGKSWPIPCPSMVRPILIDLRAQTIAATGCLNTNDQVFKLSLFSSQDRSDAHPLKEYLVEGYVTDRINTLSKIVGETCSPHRLRHTAATLWMNQTGQIKAIKAILGHSDTSPTHDYIHPDLDAARLALNAL
jgi:integrase/recombinase XerC